MAQFHAWACEAAQASIILDVPKKAALKTPCKAQAALLWLSKKEVWLASCWLAGFLVGHPPAWKNLVLTWLKLAGPPRCLGAALWRHCPSHKRSKVDGTIPRVGLRSSPGVDCIRRSEKGCTINSLQGPGCLAKSGLCLPGLAGFWLSKKEVWLASGWLAGFLVGHPPAWKNLVLTWLKLAGPPRCLGAALWRHCASHKRSKVDGTIPRVGLRSSPGVDRLGRPEKGCTTLTPCKAQAALPNQASAGFWLSKKSLVGFWLAGWLFGWTSPCLEKSRTYLAETGWTSSLPGSGLVEALPLPQTKQSRWHNSTRGLAKQPRRRSPWTSRKRLHC